MNRLLLGLLALATCTSLAQAQPAELVVRGARIHTVDDARPQATAFAVSGGRFVAVGTDAEIAAHIGATTRVLDLAGKTIVPGFNDAHIHPRPLYPEEAPWSPVDVGPGRVSTMDELIAALRRKAAVTPPGQWISGGRYQETKLGRHPTRHDLDAASTEHPIIITHSSGHQSVVNSRALALGGVTRDTPNPSGGNIVKDETGDLTGRLQESAAGLVRGAGVRTEVRPPESAQIEGYRACLAEYLARGITSIGVAGGSPVSADLLAKALDGKELIRIHQMLRETDLDEAVRRKEAGPTATGGLHYTGIKLFHGNSLSGQTCWLYEPYAHDSSYFGVPPSRSQEDLNALVLRVHRAGLQACIHSNGDREIDMVLTAFAEAQRVHPRPDPRHRIEHASVVNARIVSRFKEIGVIAVPHSYLFEHGDKHENYGPARWEWMHAARSFLDAGVAVAGHSDSPVAMANPLLCIQDMVTRRSEQGKVYGASQRITPAEALRIWTLGGAYATFSENDKGSITTGKLADFVVLGADPLTVDPLAIKDIPVEMTVVGGKLVYAAKANAEATQN